MSNVERIKARIVEMSESLGGKFCKGWLRREMENLSDQELSHLSAWFRQRGEMAFRAADDLGAA